MKPSIGRIVLYQLTDGDVARIDRICPATFSGNNASRHYDVMRNHVFEGQILPAIVVGLHGSAVNLSVLLDGSYTYWVTSVMEGTDSGQWSWPPRV